MAVTIDPITNGDYTRIDRADATTNWSYSGQWAKFSLNTTSNVENTGCMESDRVDPGVGEGWATFTSRSFENVHLRCWSKLAQNISSLATYGAQLGLGDDTDYGCWKVYGSDRQVVVYNGWMMLVADPRKPFDGATGGTIPTDILAIVDAGIKVDFVDANGKALVVLDMIWEGNEVSVEGGTTGARGTFAEWSTDDRSNGYGILREVGGIYYLNSGAVFQDVGTSDSYFEDTNAVIVFEDLPVSGSMYKFRHVGNATGTNHFQLGESSGSGTTKEGSGGGVLRAAGDAPYRIEAIDTNVDVVGYYGVTMLGNDALYDDQYRNVKVEDNGTSFTDITSNANGGAGRTNPDLMPTTQALNDATYYGHDERFYELNLILAVAKGGTWTGTWEYYDGSTWSSLTDLTDGTSNYSTTGAQTVTYAIPDDWATTTIDSDVRYWIRFRISSFTSSGTTPTMNATTGITCAMAGDIRLEDSAAEIISCNISGMGSIRVRNGAFLKKTTIDGSITPAKHAALDLGGSNPTSDTVRDLVIQNCSKGILLKGSGDVSYTLQEITFSGNTNDVRVDFGGGDTVTINVSGGDTPTVDNVNSSTVNIVNTKTITINVKDTAANAIPYATVRVEKTSDGSLVTEGIANDLGVYTDSAYNHTGDIDVDVIVRKNSPGETRYIPVRSPATITGDFTTTVSLIEDSNAGLVAPVGILRQGAVSEDESGNAIVTAEVNVPDTGTSRKLVVGAFYWDSPTNLTVSAATYDGNAMTNIAGGSAVEQEGAGNYHEIALYRYDIPDSDEGVKTISITWSANVAIKAIAFAILDDIATGAADDSANNTGDTAVGNPSVTLNNTAAAWSIVFSMVDDTDSPSATGVATIKRSDLSVDGLKMIAVLSANRTTTGSHSLGADYGANNKTWVSGGATFLKN